MKTIKSSTPSETEEMRFRQRVVEYAIKHDNNAKAARRYHTSRQQVCVESRNTTIRKGI